MKPIKLFLITASLAIGIAEIASSESSAKILRCETRLYDIPGGDYINLPKGAKYFYYGRRYGNWHSISSFTNKGKYILGSVTTEALFCEDEEM